MFTYREMFNGKRVMLLAVLLLLLSVDDGLGANRSISKHEYGPAWISGSQLRDGVFILNTEGSIYWRENNAYISSITWYNMQSPDDGGFVKDVAAGPAWNEPNTLVDGLFILMENGDIYWRTARAYNENPTWILVELPTEEFNAIAIGAGKCWVDGWSLRVGLFALSDTGELFWRQALLYTSDFTWFNLGDPSSTPVESQSWSGFKRQF